MANTKQYTEDEAAHALSVLKANGGNAKRTAKLLGIPRTTLRQWAGRAHSETAVPKKVDPKTQTKTDTELAKRFEKVIVMATDEQTLISKVEKASFADLLKAADIATRGRALLSGAPTSRSEQVRVSLMEPGELGSASLRVIEGGRKEVQNTG